MARRLERQMEKREQRDELLSAYLDDQLDAQTRTRLETRLATDPALRAEMETLRRTVALVRDLPQEPIPRNFILPQTAAARRRPAPSTRPRHAWAAPLLTAATSAVGLLFVVVLVGDLLLLGTGAPAPAPTESHEVAMEASPVSKEAEEIVEAGVTMEAEKIPPIEAAPTAAPPAEQKTEVPLAPSPGEGSPGKEETQESVESPAPERGADAAPTDTAAPTPTGLAAMAGAGDETPSPPPAPTPTPTRVEQEAPQTPTATHTPGEEEKGYAEPAPTGVPEETLLPDKEKEEEKDTATARDEQGAGLEQLVLAWATPWRILETALALATLGLVAATILAWRARRR